MQPWERSELGEVGEGMCPVDRTEALTPLRVSNMEGSRRGAEGAEYILGQTRQQIPTQIFRDAGRQSCSKKYCGQMLTALCTKYIDHQIFEFSIGFDPALRQERYSSGNSPSVKIPDFPICMAVRNSLLRFG